MSDSSRNERPRQGKLGHEINKLKASTEEEIRALKVDLFQEPEKTARDSSGHVVDELAEAEIAKFTEVGPLTEDRGAESLTPGRDETSRRLRQHRPHSRQARVEHVAESDLGEHREETRPQPKADEGAAA